MFSRSKTAKSLDTKSAEELDPVLQHITTLWKTVYEGLYKSSIKDRRYRINKLHALCLGAGASIIDTSRQPSSQDLLGPLDHALKSEYSDKHSFHYFQVHKETSSELKEDLKQILEAFAAEIKQVDLLEQLLGERQVPLREPEDSDWAGTHETIKPIAVSTGRKLLHYHARLGVLQMDMERQVVDGELGDDGWVVLRNLVYPRQSKSSWSVSAI